MAKRNRVDIPERIKLQLWLKAGGRCQYKGCNKPLWRDDLTLKEMNRAYIAHIIDVNPQTHRYDKSLSPKLSADINNLMLLCDEHHRLIDREGEKEHSVERLQKMKQIHEKRIELLTSISPDKKSYIILYGANIGEHSSNLSCKKAAIAMTPEWYPAENNAIELSLKNSSFIDKDNDYWKIEIEHLRKQFNTRVKPRFDTEIEHVSIFGLAPQPLLIELGRLFSDIPAAEIYQLHREPPDWKWQNKRSSKIKILEPKHLNKKNLIALNISLSATIIPDRIHSILGKDCAIWTITTAHPNNDFIKTRAQLHEFREKMRLLLNKIKSIYGEGNKIHIFPAMPVSAAVELGRIWMPKADLPLIIYDQNNKNGGFTKVHEIC